MKKTLPILILIMVLSQFAKAQTKTDSLAAEVTETKKKVTALDWLRKFKVSGYAQMQFQHIDTVGAKSFEGGDFPSTSANRFALRRGRVKFEFANENKKGVVNYYATVQFNINETGITPIEFYGKVVDPWTNWLAFTGGMMNRPFGYEVIYSSRSRETPERGRMSQSLFPRERDLGFMFTIEPPKTSKLNFFKINAGMYNGTGLGNAEIDNRKDFIGQIVLNRGFAENHFKLSGGASYYHGYVMQSTPAFYTIGKDTTDGALRYIKTVDSAGQGKRFFKRQYIGFDLQMTGEYKWGRTTVRGEYIFGTQPGTSSSDLNPVANGSDIYNRNFNGAYFYLIQGLHDTKHNMWHELVFKYDWFDPNSRIAGKDLSSVNDARVSGADVKYQTFEVGYNFQPNEWLKVMAHYAIVLNEKTNINGFSRDLKDNVFTLRTQFMFK